MMTHILGVLYHHDDNKVDKNNTLDSHHIGRVYYLTDPGVIRPQLAMSPTFNKL